MLELTFLTFYSAIEIRSDRKKIENSRRESPSIVFEKYVFAYVYKGPISCPINRVT